MWRKENLSALLVGKLIGAATMGNNMEGPQKIKNRITTRSNSFTPEYLSQENENPNLKRYTHPNVLCSIIHGSQDMEAT